jgi:hypothetical protein
MKNIYKSLRLLLIPVFIDLIIIIVLAATGTTLQLAGFSFGACIVIIFSLIWVFSINRIHMSNVIRFIKRFIIIFLGKLVFLLAILILSLDILRSDRIYFVLGFIITSLFAMPIEIWFCLKKGKTDAGL